MLFTYIHINAAHHHAYSIFTDHGTISTERPPQPWHPTHPALRRPPLMRTKHPSKLTLCSKFAKRCALPLNRVAPHSPLSSSRLVRGREARAPSSGRHTRLACPPPMPWSPSYATACPWSWAGSGVAWSCPPRWGRVDGLSSTVLASASCAHPIGQGRNSARIARRRRGLGDYR